MNASDWYPELRQCLDHYEADEVAARLHELVKYGETIAVTGTGCGQWVLLPAAKYDALVAALVACDNLIEARRQAAEPLPSL